MRPLIKQEPVKIEIGTFKTVEDLREALDVCNYHVSREAAELFSRLTLSSKPTILNLGAATNADLGYPDRCTIGQSFAAIAALGGVRLPAEIGPQFRLQYPGQPDGELRLFYMDPLNNFGGDPDVFYVENCLGDQWLSAHCADLQTIMFGHRVWMFGL